MVNLGNSSGQNRPSTGLSLANGLQILYKTVWLWEMQVAFETLEDTERGLPIGGRV
jgi:hypothetical protein